MSSTTTTSTTHFFAETAVLTGRSIKHITRSIDTIVTTAIIPIAFMLLFVFVFGGAVRHGSGSYVNYLLPGILLITVASEDLVHRVPTVLDLKGGIFARFQSMPIARSSVLWAHVVTSLVANLVSVVVVVLVALLIGFRSGAGILSWLAVAGILGIFTLALTWLAVIPGLTAKTVGWRERASRTPLIFLPFISSAFVPHVDNAGPDSRVRRLSAGHVDREHHSRPVGRKAGQQRYLDSPRVVRGHPDRRIRRLDDRLPPTNRVTIDAPISGCGQNKKMTPI